HRKNRFDVRYIFRAAICAQRLAASQEKSREPTDQLHRVWQCSTPRGITGKIASNIAHTLLTISPCSTPRGITGKIAAVGFQISRRIKNVLNASRHHRKNRSPGVAQAAGRQPCSTPRGITGKIAWPRKGVRRFPTCAQRLAASQEKS